MMTIIDYIERIQNAVQALESDAELLEKYYYECDFEMLLSKEKKSVRTASELHSLYRELSQSLYEMIPGLERIIDIEKIECDAFGISVERLEEFDFPVYKISLPMLLPNMRRRKEDYNNAVT